VRRRVLPAVATVLLAVFAYDAVLRSLLTGLVRLPGLPGGLTVLTSIMALFSLAHAWYCLGGRLTLAFFGLSAIVSWAFEQVGVATGLVFGAYQYTDYLGGKLGHVPLLIPLAWFMMIYPSYVIANLALERRPTGTPGGAGSLLRLAAASAAVMTVWDLVIDPILSGPQVRAWVWETGGPYYGVPIQNYLGWLATTFAVYLAYRAIEQQVAPLPASAAAAAGRIDERPAGLPAALGPVDRRVAALPVAAYGLMLAANLLSGVAPAGLAIVGLLVMGPPLALAAWRLRRLSPGVSEPAGGRAG